MKVKTVISQTLYILGTPILLLGVYCPAHPIPVPNYPMVLAFPFRPQNRDSSNIHYEHSMVPSDGQRMQNWQVRTVTGSSASIAKYVKCQKVMADLCLGWEYSPMAWSLLDQNHSEDYFCPLHLFGSEVVKP